MDGIGVERRRSVWQKTGTASKGGGGARSMKVIIYGATGMIGQGVLRECLLDPRVDAVLSVARRPTGQQHPKLKDLVRSDLADYAGVEDQLKGYDACFFTLGVSAAGMSEADYTKVTYELTMAAAKAIAQASPNLTFIYVSGMGTDSTEKGRSMWARVKGRTENALLAMPFKGAYMFRPGAIQALHGIKSRTPAYRVFYAVAGWWMLPLMKLLAPNSITTTEAIGKAMISVAQDGAPKKLLDPRDINSAAASAARG
jgi:uncharacterized protein YbjT (DUF2867 family)